MAETLEGPRWGPADGGAPRQLVLLLHGVGADGFDLIDLAPGWGRAVPGALFIAPHAPEPCDLAPFGRQWFSLRDRTPAMLLAGAEAAATRLAPAVLAELRALGLGTGDLALFGFSQGAMTALHLGLHRLPGCAALLAYSGAMVGAAPPASGASPIILLVHGEADDVVPAAASRRAEAALRAAGHRVEAMFRPGLGHGIDDAGIEAGALALRSAFQQDAR